MDTIKRKQAEKNWDLVKTDVSSDKYTFIHFVPKTLNLDDSSRFSKNDILQRAEEVKAIGIGNLPRGVFAKIQVVQDRCYHCCPV